MSKFPCRAETSEDKEKTKSECICCPRQYSQASQYCITLNDVYPQLVVALSEPCFSFLARAELQYNKRYYLRVGVRKYLYKNITPQAALASFPVQEVLESLQYLLNHTDTLQKGIPGIIDRKLRASYPFMISQDFSKCVKNFTVRCRDVIGKLENPALSGIITRIDFEFFLCRTWDTPYLRDAFTVAGPEAFPELCKRLAEI